jgi:peptide/nickel transport system substrate-binding protein
MMEVVVGRSIRLLVRMAVLVLAIGLAPPVGLLPESVGAADNSGPGGTLKVGYVPNADKPFDPQKSNVFGPFEVFRRCFLRTLLSFSDLPTEGGGTILRPDLATDLPDITPDGLTWTFHMKSGLHYAPPFDEVEIRSYDIVTALERTATIDGAALAPYFSVIQGFDEFSQGDPANISGLVTPDPYTLRIQLKRPTGDFGRLMSLATTAPIPPLHDQQQNAASGLDEDYGPYLISSGPYMWQRTPDLDLNVPFVDQDPLWTLQDGSWDWVRNPSWDPETDPLRPAIPDQIVVMLSLPNGDYEAARNTVDEWVRQDVVDMDLNGIGNQATVSMWNTEPSLRDSVSNPPDDDTFVKYIAMNVAMPPLDDPHVRRAIAYALDRNAFYAAWAGKGPPARPATHIVYDSLESGLLTGYDPYPPTSDVTAAQSEMKQSMYDADQDGVCDDTSCRELSFPVLGADPPIVPSIKALVRPLDRLGISIRFVPFDPSATPESHYPFNGIYWGPDFANASSVFAPLLTSSGIGNGSNFSLTGATPPELKHLGYTAVDQVPSIDDRFERCQELEGQLQTWCWARLDQYAMETLVALVPLEGLFTYLGTSRNVTGEVALCPSGVPALDRVVVSRA